VAANGSRGFYGDLVMSWEAIADFRVLGIPKGQPRARKGRGGFYNPSVADSWKECIAIAAKPHLPDNPLEGPIQLWITYLLPCPQRPQRLKTRKHIKTPDLDNLNKAVLDCLTAIGMWQDDKQVCELNTVKYYALTSQESGAEIFVAEWRD